MLVTTTWKYWTIQRPHGTSYSQGHVVTMTRDSRDMATATGRAEGKMVESRKMRFVNGYFMRHIRRINLHFLVISLE